MAWHPALRSEIATMFRGLSVFDTWRGLGMFAVKLEPSLDDTRAERRRRWAADKAASGKADRALVQRIFAERVAELRAEGRTYAQIAASLNRSIGAVYNAAKRIERGEPTDRRYFGGSARYHRSGA